jgi:hypothetical protein
MTTDGSDMGQHGEVEVSTMSEVLRAPKEGFVCLEYDIRGTMGPKDGAVWRNDVKWVWFEDNHVTDPRCPTCMSAEPCHQQVELYPLRGHILVIHESEDDVPEAQA